jgi:hypothetical protein
MPVTDQHNIADVCCEHSCKEMGKGDDQQQLVL